MNNSTIIQSVIAGMIPIIFPLFTISAEQLGKIQSVQPTTISPGQLITIEGTNFAETTTVRCFPKGGSGFEGTYDCSAAMKLTALQNVGPEVYGYRPYFTFAIQSITPTTIIAKAPNPINLANGAYGLLLAYTSLDHTTELSQGPEINIQVSGALDQPQKVCISKACTTYDNGHEPTTQTSYTSPTQSYTPTIPASVSRSPTIQ